MCLTQRYSPAVFLRSTVQKLVGMGVHWVRLFLVMFLLAAPLSAQTLPDRIEIAPADVDITFSPIIQPAPVTVVSSDSLTAWAINRQTAAFEAARDRDNPPESTVERIATKVAWLGFAVLAVYVIKNAIDKEHAPHPAHEPHPDAEPHPDHPDHPLHDAHPDHPDGPTHPDHPDDSGGGGDDSDGGGGDDYDTDRIL